MRKKILITGCGGMLGKSIYKVFKKAGYSICATDINLNASWLSYLDVRDTKAVWKKIVNHNYDYIFHLAAETDLEVCQKNPDHAYKTNSFGTYNIARACLKKDIPLVYISTAGVFDGEKTSYTEYDLPHPIIVYGQSKYNGEVIIKEMLNKYYIVRAGWMVGGVEKDKKFIAKIVDQINTGKKTIYAVTDKWGTPTYTKYFAENLEKLIQTKLYNTYHMVCEGSATRYDIAREILKITGKHKKIKLIKVTSEYFKKEYWVKRPKSEVLQNLNLKYINLNLMKDWRLALRDYLKEFSIK